MLFLMNDRVLDIGEPDLCLIDIVGSAGLAHDRVSAQDVVEIARQMWFRAGPGREPAQKVRLAIAALVAMKLEADAAMFVVPREARGPRDVLVKFASAPLTVLAHLQAMQTAGTLPPHLVEDVFWKSAA